MSVTTIENPIAYSIQSTLRDYDIQITGSTNAADINPSLNARSGGSASTSTSTSTSTSQNPASWPTDHHRIPNHRPINRDLNLDERPRGSNGIEQTFLLVMFTGVALNAVSLHVTAAVCARLCRCCMRHGSLI